MNSIDNLTADANQITRVVLDDGSTVLMQLVFNAAVQRWTMNLIYGDFQANGIGVCIHPNFMREWRNVLPFGLGCTTVDGVDPVFVDDFSSGRATLHVLTAADVAAFEATYFGAGV